MLFHGRKDVGSVLVIENAGANNLALIIDVFGSPDRPAGVRGQQVLNFGPPAVVIEKAAADRLALALFCIPADHLVILVYRACFRTEFIALPKSRLSNARRRRNSMNRINVLVGGEEARVLFWQRS